MLLALILSIFFGACSSPEYRYSIDGTTSQSGYYYLFSDYEVVDSAEIVDGKYHFEGEIDSLRPVLNIGSTNLSDPNATTRFMQIVLEPGTTRVAEDNNSPTGGLRISGTKGNEALYNFAVEGMAIQEGIKHSYTREMKERYFEQYEALLLKTIKRNCDNYTGVTMLLQSGERFPAELREKLYNRLSKRMKQTSAAQQIAKQLENRDPNN